jgi:hypothetical protein
VEKVVENLPDCSDSDRRSVYPGRQRRDREGRRAIEPGFAAASTLRHGKVSERRSGGCGKPASPFVT